MGKLFKYPLILICLLTGIFLGCEKEIDLELNNPEERIVVEGYIETGEFPYVLLTRNFSFFSDAGLSDLSKLYVKGAFVSVTVDGTEHVLDELCLSTLPPALKQIILDYMGVSESELNGADICAYVSTAIQGEIGKRYSLKVTSGKHELTSSTFIPNPTPIDSLWYSYDAQDTNLVILWGRYKDPDTLGNFYRYQTKINSEPFYSGFFGSVWDDVLGNGQQLTFSVDKGYPRNSEIDFDVYGLFDKGDTIILKINSIDQDHYRFWDTMEEQLRNNGPFSSPTYVQSNIIGGLGVWGGNGSVYDTLTVPK